MIDWFQTLDTTLFRLINLSWRNGFFDWLMPILSSAPFFGPVLIAILIWVFCKGGTRGRVLVLMLIFGLCFANGAVFDPIKHAVGRLRPCTVIPDAFVPPSIGKSTSDSMPSSHAGNWFTATIIVLIYYRKTLWYLLPLAIGVSYSRIYNGVHYPSDVLAGAVLGAGSGAFFVWTLHSLWQWLGPRLFPIWHAQIPSLINPVYQKPQSTTASTFSDTNWLRLGYIFIAALFIVRIVYLTAGKIELSEDEAYQWLWSKHPALSYFSKPPLIAYTQFVENHIFGDTLFGVRFFSPVIAAILSILLLRFMAREYNARAAVVLLLITSVTILMAVGAILMTIDPLSVLFWMAAMIIGWKAVQPNGTTRDWLWVGVWMGMGFLSKYTNLFQWICWGVFFILWAPARKHLRRPGPYLAILVNCIFTLPVLVWNAQNHWITIEHVASDGHLNEPWHFSWKLLKFTGDFVGSELGLLNPVFFIGMIWAACAFWKRFTPSDQKVSPRYPLQLFLFSMGAPLFLFYFLFSFHSRVMPNWIAPSIIPLFCLMVIYFGERWSRFKKPITPWFITGVVIGLCSVILAHDTNLVSKLVHRTLPPKLDVLHRVRGWQNMAETLGNERRKLETKDGKPVFIIGDHYGITSLATFYLPEARERARKGEEAIVYFESSDTPQNQFYFWPDYKNRKGQNAIYFCEVDSQSFQKGWFVKWVKGETDLYAPDTAPSDPPPSRLLAEFESVKDLGIRKVVYRGRTMRRIQLFECHNLK